MNLVFNELALEDMPIDNDEAIKIMNTFVICYSKLMASELRFSRSVITNVDLNKIMLNDSYHVSQWRNVTDRDVALRFKGLCNLQKIQSMSDDEIELSCARGVGKGLLSAWNNHDVAISLRSHPVWDEFMVDAKIYYLLDDSEEMVQVANLSDENQINKYYKKLKSFLFDELIGLKTPTALQKQRYSLFPYLIFHKKAIKQIEKQVQPQHVSAIVRKLQELNDYFSSWNSGPFDPEAFETKLTPESQITLEMYKKEHTFVYGDKEILVSYHLRYTGDIPGRIYFYPDPITRKGLVCSLTQKLRTVNT